jgi:hypothetical protein
VLGHDEDLRPGLPLGARPAVLLQPADHAHAPALLEVLAADLGEPRPGGDVEVRDLFLRLLVLFEEPVRREREAADRGVLRRVLQLRILHNVGSLRAASWEFFSWLESDSRQYRQLAL